MRNWWNGNTDGDWVSMAVILEEPTYGVDPGICFSVPVNIVNGEWKIVEGLQLSDFSKEKLKANEKELQKEKKLAFGGL